MARKGKRNPRGTCPGGERNDVKIGVCGPCGRYRTLWLPAGLCERCLVAAAQDRVDTQALIADLEKLEAADAVV